MNTYSLITRPPISDAEQIFVAKTHTVVCCPQFDQDFLKHINPSVERLTYMQTRRLQDPSFWLAYCAKYHIDPEPGFLHNSDGSRMTIDYGWPLMNITNNNFREYLVWHAKAAIAGTLYGVGLSTPMEGILLDEWLWDERFDAGSDRILNSLEAQTNGFIESYFEWSWRIVLQLQNRLTGKDKPLVVPNYGSFGMFYRSPLGRDHTIDSAMIQCAINLGSSISDGHLTNLYLLSQTNKIGKVFLGIYNPNGLYPKESAEAYRIILDAPNVYWQYYEGNDVNRPSWEWEYLRKDVQI